MSKHTSNELQGLNQSLHSTPQGDELSPQQLQDFFQKIADNSASQVFAFQVHPDLDNPSQALEIHGIWEITDVLYNPASISAMQLHLSIDGTFTDIATSPFSLKEDFNTSLISNVLSNGESFYMKIGGTVSGINAVWVNVRMKHRGE